MRRHRPEDHGRRCYCGRRATVHVAYGTGCGNVCGIHANVIERRKGHVARSSPITAESPRAMEAVFYKGKLAATVTAERIFLDPDFARLPEDDPDRRFVSAMALYARDVAAGELKGPYDTDEAERYARAFLEAADSE